MNSKTPTKYNRTSKIFSTESTGRKSSNTLKNRCIDIQSFFFVLGGQNVQYCAFHDPSWRFALSLASQNLFLLFLFLCVFLAHPLSLSIPKQKAGERRMWSDTGERLALLRLKSRRSSREMNKPGCSVTMKPSTQLKERERERFTTDPQDQESIIIWHFWIQKMTWVNFRHVEI